MRERINERVVNTILIVCFSIITLLLILNLVATSQNPYDVNRDGKVTSADYIEIKNYIMEVQNEN